MIKETFMDSDFKFEICIDSVEAAIASEAAGAHRVELCCNLIEGGITPSAGMISETRKNIAIKLNVMIRPRGGDFCYSNHEFEIMKRDIKIAKDLGADAVVLGILKPDGSVDTVRVGELIELARPLDVTFHRAFDMVEDPFEALEDIINLGIQRLLTSGCEISVLEGLDLICKLKQIASDRIIIMPGGGVTQRNIEKIISESGVKEIHFACLSDTDSSMTFRNKNCFMGGELRPPEFSIKSTKAEGVRAVIKASKQL